jgi:GNAT superfamily N-acetyltransferase
MSDDLARAFAMERRFDERLCTRKEPYRFGTAYFDERHRDRFVSNFLSAEMDLDAATADDLMREADRVLGGAGYEHRMILVRDEAHGERMAADLVAAGYRADPIVLMAHRRQPDRPGTVAVEEVSFPQARPVIAETYRRDERFEQDRVDRFTDQHGWYERALGARFFVGRVDTQAAGVCELWLDGADALVEHVDTLEEFRNRGVARSVVLAAVDAAVARGAERVFIAADDNDWPKELYGRLGFDRLGREWEFIRWPASASPP